VPRTSHACSSPKGTGQTPKTDLALADGMMAGVMADDEQTCRL
jgi:hypothetical protein